MLKCIVTAAVAALLMTPAWSQSGTSSSGAKAHAAKPHAAPKKAAKAKAAHKKSKKKSAHRKAPKVVKLTPETRHKLLLDVASVNRDLIDFALDGKSAKVAEKVAAMRKTLPTLRAALGVEAFEDITGHVARLEQDAAGNDLITAALDAAEAYRTVEEAVDAAMRPAPLEVALLDYSGLKLNVLAASPTPDWPAIAAASREAVGFWARVEDKVNDAALQRTFARLHDDFQAAVALRNIQAVKRATKMQVDAVVVLKKHFNGAGAARPQAER
jgi:hypothetical protein